MPIYQRRVFAVAKPLTGVKSDDSIFTIPHTGEQFQDETEYRERCALYAQEVWVCQCTGHTGLTHKEAWDSEHKIRNMLEASFPEFLHKPILSVVHHSTKSLDTLIDEVLILIHNRFHQGEVVTCHKHDKARATVVDVTDPENVCSSPCSDKENKSGQPSAAAAAAAAAPNGRFPPPHLPLRYTVQMEQSGKVVADLPAAELSRAERLPNRDMLRLFIRSNAVRQGTSTTAPWVVSPHLFIQLGLKNKIASIFLPSSDRKNGINSSLPPKKRKLIDTPKEKPAKKAKSNDAPRSLSKSGSKSAIAGDAAAAAAAKAAAVTPKPAPAADSDSDCEVLANIASSSKTKTVLNVTLSPNKNECRSSLSVVLSPLKTKPTVDVDSDSSDDDVKLSVIAKSPMKKLSLGTGASPAKKSLFGKTGKDSPKKKEKKAKDNEKSKKNKDKTSKKDDAKKKSGADKKPIGRPKKLDGKSKPEKRPVGRPKKDQKAMRQMSLFDLGKKVSKTSDKTPGTPQKGTPQKGASQKGTPKGTPKKSSSPQKKPSSPVKSPAKRSLPPCVRRLIRQLDAGKKLIPSSSVVKTCAKWLTHQQISDVQNERARQLIERSRAKMDELRLMSRMSAAQKEEYLKMKKEEERRARLADTGRKFFEDQTLHQLTPLPTPTPVQLPPGLPAHLFGEAVMVAEFLHAYSPLLVPAGTVPVPADQLLLALAGSRPHHRVLLDVVTMLLKVLLAETSEGRKELSTPLRQVPITPQTASELVRLALRPADADSDADSDAGDEHEEPLTESLLERLEQCELFELTTAERLEVLRVLVHRLLDTDSLADRHRDLCVKKDAIAKDMRTKRQEEAAAAAAAAPAAVTTAAPGAPTAPGTPAAPTAASATGTPAANGTPAGTPAATGTPAPAQEPGQTDSPAPASGVDASMDDADDLASRTKRSRRNLEQARREKEEREREKREKRERELEAARLALEAVRKAEAEAALLREYQELKAEAARVLRRAPLGTDRQHRRYWLLGSLPGALYVEAGWAGRETIEYRVQPPGASPAKPGAPGASSAAPATGAAAAQDSDEDDQPLTVVQRRCLFEKDQATAPEPTENRWFCFTTLAEVDQLRAALAVKGERESALRDALTANSELIRAALQAKPEPVPEKTSLVEATPSADPAKNTQSTPAKTEAAVKAETPAKTETAKKDGAGDAQEKNVKMETDANANTETKMETDETQSETKPDAPEAEVKSEEAKTDVKPDTEEDEKEDNGYQFLISTLKEDILGIEEELSAGWLGAVPEPSAWAARVLEAETADQLGAAVLECERHIRREVLQGPLAPARGPAGADGQQPQSAGGQRWADAVRACRTLSRLHVLVGLLDSAIRWDLSTAQKKCRICRRRGEGLVALCTQCKQLYHWGCLRPALLEQPEDNWQCYACRPVPKPQRDGRRQRARRYVEEEPLYEEEPDEEEVEMAPAKESECRVCTSPEEKDMIHCTKCPAAFHKTCHEPPMLLRVRPGWECMDCKAPPRKRVRGRVVGPKPPLPSALLRQARANLSDEEQAEDEEEEEEEHGEEEEEEGDEDGEEGEEEEEAEADQTEAHAEEAAVEGDDAAEADPGSSPEPTKPSSKKRAPRRRPRPVLMDDDDEDEAEDEDIAPSRSRRDSKPRRSFVTPDSGSEEERAIRALSSDEEDSVGRRARRRSSHSRRADVRARCRRQPRKRYVEKSESDMEASDTEATAAALRATARQAQASPEEPTKPSPSKVEMVQQAGAVCMYCDQPSTRRNELAVCQSCPSMYHRRCAKAAGLVDAWQCRQCVLPSVYRARPVRPRTSEDFEYDE